MRKPLIGLTALLLAAASLWAQAARYVVFELPSAVPPDFFITEPAAINASGAVVGVYSQCAPQCSESGGFIRNPNGSFVVLPDLSPNAINAGGTIVSRNVVVGPDGSRTPIDIPGAYSVYGYAINTRGDVAGVYSYPKGEPYGGFVRTPDGAIALVRNPGSPADSTTFYGINDAGVAAGVTSNLGLLRDADGTLTTFAVPSRPVVPTDLPPGPTIEGVTVETVTQATAINEAGYTAGKAFEQVHHPSAPPFFFPLHNRGFVRSPDGSIVEFDGRDLHRRSTIVSVVGIDAAGTAVGGHHNADTGYRGFLRSPDGRLTDFVVPQMTQTYPVAVNAGGVVTGYCYDAQSNVHGFLRMP